MASESVKQPRTEPGDAPRVGRRETPRGSFSGAPDDGEAPAEGETELEIFREPGPDADDGGEAGTGPAQGPIRVLAVSGAKGGVGKTILATNVALYLASIGRRVVVVDADPAGANAHTCLGVERPLTAPGPRGIPVTAGSPLLLDTPVPGLSIAHAGLDEPLPGRLRRTKRSELRAFVASLDADYAVVDLGASTLRGHLDAWLEADLALFVCIPEPTAIDNTYRFVRMAFARRLRALAPDAASRAGIVARLREMGGAPSPLDLSRRLQAAGDPLLDLVREAMASFRFPLVLNQARVRADLEIGESMRSAARRRLGLELDYLGYVEHDDTVWATVRMRRPLLVESPGTKASKNIEKVARRLLALQTGSDRRRAARLVPAESHHDLLEVERGATDEEIRRAFKRMKDIYDSDALCAYGLFDPASLDSLRARLEEAYDVLLDPARRRPYELSVFPPDPEPRAVPVRPRADEERPPAPVITPDTEYTGPLLRAVRESQGVEASEVCHRTKIGAGYLDALERDDFGALPAPVYVRGFVAEVAKCLRLDPEQVSRSYVRRYRRYLEERERLS